MDKKRLKALTKPLKKGDGITIDQYSEEDSKIYGEDTEKALKLYKVNILKPSEFMKAKALPVGSIRTHGGRKMKKTAQGWRPVSEGDGEKKLSPADLAAEVVSLLQNRHSGNVKAAKKEIQKIKGNFKTQAQYEKYMKKFGDPDAPDQYEAVLDKWMDHYFTEDDKENVTVVKSLHKAKPLPVGSIRTHGGKKVQKTAQGWRPVKRGAGEGAPKGKPSGDYAPKAHKGVYYFGSSKEAKSWAEQNDWPTDRIVQYGRGFAVQSGKSGNYAGPGVKPKQWEGTAKAQIGDMTSEELASQDASWYKGKQHLIPVGKFKEIGTLRNYVKKGGKHYNILASGALGGVVDKGLIAKQQKEAVASHRYYVEKVLSEGGSVPSSVLADYPKLQKPKGTAKGVLTKDDPNKPGFSGEKLGAASNAPTGALHKWGGHEFVKLSSGRWIENSPSVKRLRRKSMGHKLVLGTSVVAEFDRLLKALPTVVRIKPEERKPNRKVPSSVKSYVKKVEAAFVVINQAVSDLVESNGLEGSAEVIKKYVEFKECFQWKVNDAINYPNTNYDEPVEVDSPRNESRIKVKKLK